MCLKCDFIFAYKKCLCLQPSVSSGGRVCKTQFPPVLKDIWLSVVFSSFLPYPPQLDLPYYFHLGSCCTYFGIHRGINQDREGGDKAVAGRSETLSSQLYNRTFFSRQATLTKNWKASKYTFAYFAYILSSSLEFFLSNIYSVFNMSLVLRSTEWGQFRKSI